MLVSRFMVNMMDSVNDAALFLAAAALLLLVQRLAALHRRQPRRGS
jgi:hypothetical protein